MNIDINIPSARAANTQLPPIISQAANVKNTAAALRSSIDARVLNRRNLRARLWHARNEIESIEMDLSQLHRTIEQNIRCFEEAEQRTIAMVNTTRTTI